MGFVVRELEEKRNGRLRLTGSSNSFLHKGHFAICNIS
jgi:hypothetical protein